MKFLFAFIIGGVICAVAQIFIDKTRFTPARILVFLVTAGVFITLFGWYEPLVKLAGAGATVPLSGFGYSLAKGAMKSVEEIGILGAFTGGITATSAGIAAAIFFGYFIALIFTPKEKS